MCDLLSEWQPTEATISLIKLNEISDEQIEASLSYLKQKTGLNHIDDIEGYDNWNAFFIVFCIKANRPEQPPLH